MLRVLIRWSNNNIRLEQARMWSGSGKTGSTEVCFCHFKFLKSKTLGSPPLALPVWPGFGKVEYEVRWGWWRIPGLGPDRLLDVSACCPGDRRCGSRSRKGQGDLKNNISAFCGIIREIIKLATKKKTPRREEKLDITPRGQFFPWHKYQIHRGIIIYFSPRGWVVKWSKLRRSSAGFVQRCQAPATFNHHSHPATRENSR